MSALMQALIERRSFSLLVNRLTADEFAQVAGYREFLRRGNEIFRSCYHVHAA